MVKNLRVKVPHHTARAQGFERSTCAQGRRLFLGRVREKTELYSMHLGKFKEGTRIIGIALTVGELIGALRRPVPWLRCPPVFSLTALRAGPPLSWGVTSGGPPGGWSLSKDGTRADSAKDFAV